MPWLSPEKPSDSALRTSAVRSVGMSHTDQPRRHQDNISDIRDIVSARSLYPSDRIEQRDAKTVVALNFQANSHFSAVSP